MNETHNRKLVKVYLLPEIHAALGQYARTQRRSVSSAAEYLIERGMEAEGAGPANPEIHTREAPK